MVAPKSASERSWPPLSLPSRLGPGEYSISNPDRVDEAAVTKPEHAPGDAPEVALHPAEISTVTEIVDGLSKRLDEKIARIERAMIRGSDASELSAALTLTQRSLKRWRVLGAILGTLAGGGGVALAKDERDDHEVGAAAIVERVDDLERRFDRIERKLDRALE